MNLLIRNPNRHSSAIRNNPAPEGWFKSVIFAVLKGVGLNVDQAPSVKPPNLLLVGVDVSNPSGSMEVSKRTGDIPYLGGDSVGGFSAEVNSVLDSERVFEISNPLLFPPPTLGGAEKIFVSNEKLGRKFGCRSFFEPAESVIGYTKLHFGKNSGPFPNLLSSNGNFLTRGMRVVRALWVHASVKLVRLISNVNYVFVRDFVMRLKVGAELKRTNRFVGLLSIGDKKHRLTLVHNSPENFTEPRSLKFIQLSHAKKGRQVGTKKTRKAGPSIVRLALKFAQRAKEEAVEHTMRRDIITTNTVERIAYNAAEGALKAYRRARGKK